MTAVNASYGDVDPVGAPTPRIGPPTPLRVDLAAYDDHAGDVGITPMPWQHTAVSYLNARGPERYAFREVAVVVGRQNGKTTLVKPLIIERLMAGRRVMHIAQVRELPRMMFDAIATALEMADPQGTLFYKRRGGRIIWPRRGSGSEVIELTNGGTYRIAAAVSGAARGHSIDDLIIDELREMTSFDVINAAKPAQRFSTDPQTIYMSNAGTDDSVVLNSLRTRGEAGDPSLAYLEWSADPDYDPGDIRGWVQANPAIGHFPSVLRDLETDYTAARLGGNMAGFETEALCRWVKTMRPVLVDHAEWIACRSRVRLPASRRQHVAVSMDPDGTRASIASAWLGADDMCYLTIVDDVHGTPVDTAALGTAWRDIVTARRVARVGLDPLTDGELGELFKTPKPISGGEFANATANFVRRVKSGTLRWADADVVGDDLTWTSRKENDETGSFAAVRANDDRPINAALAAIRAVWLATGLRSAAPRVY